MSDNVSITLSGKDFEGWESLTINRSMSQIADAFSMSAPFRPDRQNVARAFQPYKYRPVEIMIDGQLVLTGTCEAVSYSIDASDNVVNVQGRSKTGALVECAIDGGKRSWANLTLSGIAQQVIDPFGYIKISAIADSPKIKQAIAEVGQTCAEFLLSLSMAHGLILRTNANGDLVIDKPTGQGSPVAQLIQGQGGLISVSASYDGTRRFSQYKAIQQQDGAQSIVGTADDSGVGTYRPFVATGAASDGQKVADAAKWLRAKALAESVEVTAVVTGWRNNDGRLWQPGDIVMLEAPGVYFRTMSRMMIDEVTLTLDASQGRTASMRLIMPETYSGNMPDVEPWE